MTGRSEQIGNEALVPKEARQEICIELWRVWSQNLESAV